MRRRLLITYLAFTAVLLLGTEIPLGFNLAMNNYHHLVIRQVSETSALASAAEADSPAEDLQVSAAWRTRADAYGREANATVVLFDARGRAGVQHAPRHTGGPGDGVEAGPGPGPGR